MALFQLLKHAQAIQNYTKAIQLDSEFANAYHNRGWAYYLTNERDLALADIDKAIELDDRNADSFNNRATIYFNQQRY